jgi:hypothetical protein
MKTGSVSKDNAIPLFETWSAHSAICGIVSQSSSDTSIFISEHLVWSDEFDRLDESKWQHFVTGWRGGNGEFQYYRNNRTNSYVKDGVLYIKPTLTSDQYGEDFLYKGKLNLRSEGCTDESNIDNGCSM